MSRSRMVNTTFDRIMSIVVFSIFLIPVIYHNTKAPVVIPQDHEIECHSGDKSIADGKNPDKVHITNSGIVLITKTEHRVMVKGSCIITEDLTEGQHVN